MPFSVEMALLSAAYSGTDAVTANVEWCLINESNQNVVARKTVTITLPLDTGAFEAKEILRQKYDEAIAWGQFLLSAQKLAQMVGQKVRTRID